MTGDQENSFFTTLEIEKMRSLRKRLEDDADEQARAELKALHYLKCGKCGHDMTTTAFRGVEIEICDNCRAVLLDPGELEQVAGTDQGAFLNSLLGMFRGPNI